MALRSEPFSPQPRRVSPNLEDTGGARLPRRARARWQGGRGWKEPGRYKLERRKGTYALFSWCVTVLYTTDLSGV